MGNETEKLWKSEDYWAIWFALALFVGILCGAISAVPKVGRWTTSPFEAFPEDLGISVVILGISLGALMTVGLKFMKEDWKRFFCGYLFIFLLAVVSYTIAGQVAIKAWGFGYAIWALFFGLLIANTLGTPRWVLKGARSEMFIKTGLVLLGGEILSVSYTHLTLPTN